MMFKTLLCVLLPVAVEFHFVKGLLLDVKYNMTLSNSGPAVVGSELTFQANLLTSTGGKPHDEKYFIYKWENNVDHKIKRIPGNFNSTLRKCYRHDTNPGLYKIDVDVYDQIHYPWIMVANQSQNFMLTEHLNGMLTAHQTLDHRNPDTPDVFSTVRPVTLKVNLTDSYWDPPTMTYIWSIDGTEQATNNPSLQQTFDLGEHNVKVNVKMDEEIDDCDGEEYEKSPTGTFIDNFTMKDPVMSVEIHSKVRDIPPSHKVMFPVSFNGSGPFRVCWSILGDGNGTEVNETVLINCTCDTCIEKPGDYDIMIRAPSHLGDYVLNITVENDVSVVSVQKNFTVEHRTPSSPSSVAVPVTCSLLGLCALLALAVYIAKRPKKKHRSEVANFDFHPTTLTVGSRSREDSFIASIKPRLLYIRLTFKRLFRRDNYERDHRYARYMRARADPNYGSITDSVSLTL